MIQTWRSLESARAVEWMCKAGVAPVLKIARNNSVSGWDGVHDKVDRLHAAHPGFVFQPSGLAVAHHGLACQRWRFGPPDASDAITGIDVAIFEKGFIKALYVFIDGGTSASLARGWPLSA